MFSALLVAATIAAPCAAQTETTRPPDGIVTIFHEPAGKWINPVSSKDQWPERMHRKMLLDGEPLVFFHGQGFVSFRIPAGRHSVTFDSLGISSADFELHPGERVFVRPAFQHVLLGDAHFLLSVVPCKQAVQAAQQARPIDAKYIEHSGALPEDHFPESCDAEAAQH